jgi:hypothetical protein
MHDFIHSGRIKRIVLVKGLYKVFNSIKEYYKLTDPFIVNFNRGPSGDVQLRLLDRGLEPQELHLVRVHQQLRLAHGHRHLLLRADCQGRRHARVGPQGPSQKDECRKSPIERCKTNTYYYCSLGEHKIVIFQA